MAIPSNTYLSYDTVGIREDLSDVIYRISPTETPFQSNIPSTKATQRIHEWQIQTLAAAVDTNAVLEGDDATTDAATPTTRPNNRTQISDKVARVSGSNEVFDKAGRGGELAYQVLLKGLELKRDLEKQMLSNKASVAGSTGAVSQSGGFMAWLETNTTFGTSGADGGFKSSTSLVAARTAGDTRKFNSSHVDETIEDCFIAGGNPSMLMAPPGLKTRFSAFTGIADLRRDVNGMKEAVIVGGADAYISNFGTLTVVPNRFQSSTTVFLIDPKMVKKAFARPMKNTPLAKTGDSERRQILVEYTLEVCNEAAHGGIFDVTKTS